MLRQIERVCISCEVSQSTSGSYISFIAQRSIRVSGPSGTAGGLINHTTLGSYFRQLNKPQKKL